MLRSIDLSYRNYCGKTFADLGNSRSVMMDCKKSRFFTRGVGLLCSFHRVASLRCAVGLTLCSAPPRRSKHARTHNRDKEDTALLAHSLIVKDGKPAHTVTAIPTGHAVAAVAEPVTGVTTLGTPLVVVATAQAIPHPAGPIP